MPIEYARKLAGQHRTSDANRHLGYALAFIAGAINAGGFMVVHEHTSHITGVVSTMAEDLARLEFGLFWQAFAVVLSFVLGAVTSTLLVGFARHRQLHSTYSGPLLLEAVLLLAFIVMARGEVVEGSAFMAYTIWLLCFLMGLQNAVITKISRSEIRTTHVTGIITDLGIEMGKLIHLALDHRARADEAYARAINRDRLVLFFTLALAFFTGGVAGAVGFSHFGLLAGGPIAVLLLGLAIVPLADDVRDWRARRRV